MTKFSFFPLIGGQVLFVFVMELLFFPVWLRQNLTEHLILGAAVIIVTSLSYVVSKKMIDADPRNFIQTVIASTTIKLILYFGLMLFLFFLYKPVSVSYVIFFLICYLIVTTTEILFLARDLRKRRNKGI